MVSRMGEYGAYTSCFHALPTLRLLLRLLVFIRIRAVLLLATVRPSGPRTKKYRIGAKCPPKGV